ncbi:hypothetical protein ACEPPN_001787 [Leptodophora sp. 'Broadleaf-Isolate-01']
MSGNDTYQTPLASRYASSEMKTLFSARTRSSTWRQLWVWLAEAERELGLPISEEAITQMKANLKFTDEDFVVAAEEEKKRRHDVMAHVHAFGLVAPAAAGIIHWGATSFTDNADLIFLRNGLDIILPKLAVVVNRLAKFAVEWKDEATLGYTHGQPAQLITVGRRACQWIQDLLMDLEDIERVRKDLIFHGDGAKIDKLNEILCEKAGFPSCYAISTQTYSRKVDLRVINALSALGATAIRITTDIRHLAAEKTLEEPFEKDQIGSSAMAYKRNPMRSERIASLGRYLSHVNSPVSDTYSSQWYERSLDDSAIRRITLPEAFLAADAVLMTLDNVANGLVVYPAVIRSRVMAELPFMATENIIMKLVSKGGNRQEAHEEIRVLSHQASAVVKIEGKPNDLIERIKANPFFDSIKDEIDEMLDPRNFIGRSAEQCVRYCQDANGEVQTALKPYASYIETSKAAELSV